ncbi:PadR family transcriptional regulator [Devosia sp. A16]|uniref:PadR family transcriptional regulator n=1 Tax=Devosia sp. A16 TaxID=1736675 RepID=UPI0006D7BA41|nr:PadR family transcriptional regulator [Devosia sp. A16]
MATSKNPPFLNSVPELLILQCLKRRQMYGYELVQAIRSATDDHIVLAEGVVYPVLHMLEREGALSTERRTVNGRSRIYYALTERGATRLAELAQVWRRLTAAIAGVLGEPRHA